MFKKIFNTKDDSFLSKKNIIFKKYKPLEIIGLGSNGKVYSTIRIKDKCMFAMKTEKMNPELKTLEDEAYNLYTLQGGVGIPKFISFGHNKEYNILIETLLDKDLFEIFIKRNRICTLSDICLIAIQILDRLEFIHSKNLIYKDIKPKNFLIGINDPNIIYVVDFGSCQKYRSSRTGKHIQAKNSQTFSSTLKYASFDVINGKQGSRRDDFISLGYMLIFLLKKRLPWEKYCHIINESNINKILSLKKNDNNGQLFKNLPEEFEGYFKYVRNLKFEQDPDYNYLRSFFNKLLLKINLDIDIKKLSFSWINPNNIRKMLNYRSDINIKKRTCPQVKLIRKLEEKMKLTCDSKSEYNSPQPKTNRKQNYHDSTYNILIIESMNANKINDIKIDINKTDLKKEEEQNKFKTLQNYDIKNQENNKNKYIHKNFFTNNKIEINNNNYNIVFHNSDLNNTKTIIRNLPKKINSIVNIKRENQINNFKKLINYNDKNFMKPMNLDFYINSSLKINKNMIKNNTFFQKNKINSRYNNKLNYRLKTNTKLNNLSNLLLTDINYKSLLRVKTENNSKKSKNTNKSFCKI